MHMHKHAFAKSELVVFAEALCSVLSQRYQRVIRLRAIYRIAFAAERRVREAMRLFARVAW